MLLLVNKTAVKAVHWKMGKAEKAFHILEKRQKVQGEARLLFSER